MEQEQANHPIATMCRILGVSSSGYYAWRVREESARVRRDAELRALIVRIHQESRGTYGAPRVHAELEKGYGIHCSRKRVARLMRESNLTGIHRRRFHGCTRRDPAREAYPDLVNRDFTAEKPNQLWVADLTQHPTGEGWLYIAVVLDLFSRMVIGWAMGPHAAASLVVDAVNMAVRHRRPTGTVIHHSDHGAQYTSLVFTRRLEEAGIRGSMGSVGDALDNAVAESFYATLQTELLDRQAWATRSGLQLAIFEYIEVFYNRRRRHSALGYLTPAEYEASWQFHARTAAIA